MIVGFTERLQKRKQLKKGKNTYTLKLMKLNKHEFILNNYKIIIENKKEFSKFVALKILTKHFKK